MYIQPNFNISKSINFIYLLLGPKCNTYCKHCEQFPIKSLHFPSTCSPIVIDFIKKLNTNNKKRILCFWGGEPLVYIDQIIDIVNQLNDCNFKYIMTSNGLLLTHDITDWLNKNNVRYSISYDAPYPLAVRTQLPSVSNINNFLSLNNRSVCSVISAQNCNIETSLSYLEKKFPNTSIFYNLIEIMSDISPDIYNFNFNECLSGLECSAQKIINNEDPLGNRDNFWKRYVNTLRDFNENKNIRLEQFIGTPRPVCNSGDRSMAIDLAGNVYPCHNSMITVGNIQEDPTILWEKTNVVWKKLIPPNCIKCECFNICRVHCAIAQWSSNKKEYTQCSAFLKKYLKLCKEVIYKYNLFDYV